MAYDPDNANPETLTRATTNAGDSIILGGFAIRFGLIDLIKARVAVLCVNDFVSLICCIPNRLIPQRCLQTQRPWIIESTDEYPRCDLKIGEISRGSSEHSRVTTHAAEYSADLGG